MRDAVLVGQASILSKSIRSENLIVDIGSYREMVSLFHSKQHVLKSKIAFTRLNTLYCGYLDEREIRYDSYALVTLYVITSNNVTNGSVRARVQS